MRAFLGHLSEMAEDQPLFLAISLDQNTLSLGIGYHYTWIGLILSSYHSRQDHSIQSTIHSSVRASPRDTIFANKLAGVFTLLSSLA